MSAMSEAEAWAGTCRRARLGATADDDVLTRLELAGDDLGHRAVADAEPHGDRLRLAVGADHPDPAAGRTRRAARLGGAQLHVARLLLGREDRHDALAGAGPDHLAAVAHLVGRQAGLAQCLELAPAVLHD